MGSIKFHWSFTALEAISRLFESLEDSELSVMSKTWESWFLPFFILLAQRAPSLDYSFTKYFQDLFQSLPAFPPTIDPVSGIYYFAFRRYFTIYFDDIEIFQVEGLILNLNRSQGKVIGLK